MPFGRRMASRMLFFQKGVSVWGVQREEAVGKEHSPLLAFLSLRLLVHQNPIGHLFSFWASNEWQ